MLDLCRLIFRMVVDLFRSRAELEAEILVLRQQINVMQRASPRRAPFSLFDRLILGCVCRLFPKVYDALAIVRPDTVIRWHRAGFQIVLALEIGATLRPTDCAVRNSLADPRDEHRQPVVGSAENPWRASQAWHRYRPDQRSQVYGAEEGPSVTRMEDFPSQPCRWYCRDGPFRSSDNLVPAS